MLTSLQLANFKAFADTQQIPVRPLTLIYGANSSGKSSIIHSLLLAKHAAETGELDVYRTNAGGESVDLGGFRQYVHRRQVNRRMEWSAELDTAKFSGRLAELLAPVKRVAVSVSVGISLDDVGRPRPGATPEVHSYEMSANGKPLLRMSRRAEDKLQLDSLDHEHVLLREVLKAIVQTSTTSEALLPADFGGLADVISSIVPEIEARAGSFLPDGLVRPENPSSAGQGMLFPVGRGTREEDLAAAVRFFLPRTLDELISGVAKAVAKELSAVRYLGPLRSYPPRHLAFSQHQDANWFAGGGYAWDVVRRDKDVRDYVNAWLSAPDRLQTPYELIVRDLIPIDQLEGPLLQALEDLNNPPEDGDASSEDSGFGGGSGSGAGFSDGSGYGSGYRPAVMDPEVEAAKMRDRISTSDIDKLSELIMFDRRSNTVVSHRDVGIGVSQVLPVLVSAYGSSSGIIAIEQPEIHLHPALQADLGDVFIESSLGERKNRFIIETHSEHLLLRIMRRMRQTFSNTLPDKATPIYPKDIMVLFVEPLGSRSIIREMPLNENGELVKAWPGGFFEEGLREVF